MSCLLNSHKHVPKKKKHIINLSGFSAPNLLVREDGRRDPQMRQKTDKGVWAAVSSSPQPTSTYLKKLNEVITTSLLEDLDQFLEKGNPTEEDIEICIKER